MALIEETIAKNGGDTDSRNWSKEDVDRLLELTDRGKQLEQLDRETEMTDEKFRKVGWTRRYTGF